MLQQGYILFAVKVVYDRGVFLTENEWQKNGGSTATNIQEEIEQPAPVHQHCHGFDIRPTGMRYRIQLWTSFVEHSSSSAGPRQVAVALTNVEVVGALCKTLLMLCNALQDHYNVYNRSF